MNLLSNKFPTKELQMRDAAHHMHPFTAQAELGEKGARVITRANGVFVYDSEGEEILDAMAGLWCVNIGYGRHELAEVAARQMKELSYYNTFFQTTHVPAIELAEKLAELAPFDLNHVFFASSGSEANDTNIRLVRHYWALKGKPNKSVIISRKNAYHGSSVGSSVFRYRKFFWGYKKRCLKEGRRLRNRTSTWKGHFVMLYCWVIALLRCSIV